MTETKPKRVRINMRVHEELVLWAKRYAKKKNTSVTQLVINYLTHLKEEAHAAK